MAIKRITTNLIKDSDIATVDIANNAITAAKITDGNITTAKLADLSVTAGKLAGTLDLTGKTITVATATTGDNDTSPASTAFVQQEIAALVDSSPDSLNTLNELAAALGDDASFSTTVTNSIATKLPLAGGTMTGTLTVADIASSGYLQLTANDVDFIVRDTTDSPTNFIWRDHSGSKLYLGSPAAEVTIRSDAIIDTGYKIGIGTDSPATNLHISESSDTTTPQLRISNDTPESLTMGVVRSAAGTAPDTSFISFDNALRFIGQTGTTNERMRITEAGNVGIGTSSPDSMLHLSAGSTGVSGGASAAITMTNKFDNPDNSWIIAPVRSGVSNTGLEIRDVTDSRTDMVFDGSGKVGIGTDSPYTTLQIAGSISTKSTNGLFYFSNSSSTTIDTSQLGVHWIGRIDTVNYHMTTSAGGFAGQAGTLGIGGKGGITFGTCTTSETYASGRMIIDEDGKVGIGCTDQSNLLTVDANSASVGTDSISVRNRGVASGNHTTGLRFQFGTAVPSAIRSRLTNTSNGEGTLSFYTSSNGSAANLTERMSIDSSGTLMVNQTSASAASAGAKMQVATDMLTTGSLAGYFWENRSGMTIAAASGWGGWYSTGSSVHYLYSDGANRASIGRTSGTYTALSDVNKKKDFEDSTVGLAEVMQLQPKKFRMLDDADDAPKKLGFVAQDVENVIPEAYVEDLADDENEETFIGLTDRPIIAALTKAIQEQQTIIDDLKSRLDEAGL